MISYLYVTTIYQNHFTVIEVFKAKKASKKAGILKGLMIKVINMIYDTKLAWYQENS